MNDTVDQISRVPISLCPHCDGLLQFPLRCGPDQMRPQKGDVTFCVYCAQPLRLGPTLRVLALPPEEIDDLCKKDADFCSRFRHQQEIVRRHLGLSSIKSP